MTRHDAALAKGGHFPRGPGLLNRVWNVAHDLWEIVLNLPMENRRG